MSQMPMNYRNGHVAAYAIAEVELYLKSHSSFLDTKHGSELLVGCILSRCASLVNRKPSPLVAYELKSKAVKQLKGKRPTLETLLSNTSQINDESVDIWLVSCEDLGQWGYQPIQIKRLDARTPAAHRNATLLGIINSACEKSACDEKLTLAVLADRQEGSFKLDDFAELKDRLVPFGQIYVVGQFGVEQVVGRFDCVELWRDLGDEAHVQLDL